MHSVSERATGSLPARPALARALRVLGAIGGGYALSALTVIAGGAVLARCGMVRSEAVVLASMLGFVLYLVLLLWAFCVRSLARLWLVLAGGMAAMAALAHLAHLAHLSN